MRDSMIFYREWRDAMEGLPSDAKVEVYDAVIEYGTSGKLPALKPMAALAFNFIKPQIDRDSQKYTDALEQRRSAGKKHKGNQYTKAKHENGTNGTSVPSVPKNGTNGTVYVDVDVLQDTNVSMCNNKPSSKEEGMLQSSASNSPRINYDGIIKYWNKLVEGKPMKTLSKIEEGTKRRAQVQARIKQYGKNDFAKALKKASQSAFLNGSNPKGWMGSFDWIILPSNFPKVLEGNYDNVDETAEGDFRQFEEETKVKESTKKKMTKEQAQAAYEQWAAEKGLDPESIVTMNLYSDLQMRAL